MSTVFFFIHGAWSSPACFNYLRDKLKDKYKTVSASYDCQQQSLDDIIKTIKKTLYDLTEFDDNVIVVGHSLGGLLSLCLEKEKRVKRVITIAAPLDGIHMNKMVEWYLAFKSPILHHIVSNSIFIKNIHTDQYTKPIDIFVATRGYNPMMNEPNDGVVTVEAQENWVPDTATITYVEATHFDILQHDDTITEIQFLGEKHGI